MGDLIAIIALCTRVVTVKTAEVAALANEWNAPNGQFFERMVTNNAKDAMERVDEITETTNTTAVLAGVIWHHGYADAFVEEYKAHYKANLESWIVSVRAAFSLTSTVSKSSLPNVVGQLGGQGLENPGDEELEMRAIQENVVSSVQEPIILTNTSQFVAGFNMTNDSPDVYDEDVHYFGRADVIIIVGEQLAKDMWKIMG